MNAMISIYTMGGLGVVATYNDQQSLIDRDPGIGHLMLRDDAKVLAKLFNLGVMTLGKYPIGMMKLVGRFSVMEHSHVKSW